MKFPSPYGVSFILILKKNRSDEDVKFKKISVSLRSIIHSYGILGEIKGVELEISVSLRSIIHSYLGERIRNWKKKLMKISVSLRSIIHSYLFGRKYSFIGEFKKGFPSPYGVSFILIIIGYQKK